MSIWDVIFRGWRKQTPKVQELVRNILAKAKEKASGLYCIWICRYCENGGYVEYGEDAEPQIVADRIIAVHQELKPGCEGNFLILDQRGIRSENSELFIAARIAAKVA
ncbi:MAG: hypothetical protein A3A08_02135 [Candidatus Nealsonbacteria bacterium RIFCSPLOWO2_01_FULL_41_9]|uniref:Uncharacterized protein n=1 Tax=Candidatus Nealsonbacteria bacterium RIFCSPLOWO2_01_FULL_41_9 TaxID=1801671 RepID=A0A1G2ECT7_9BACT|nr:MAG: hypothetical protein A3A08_02135 [Candidatus Nealsonbacteria bacterium RIFCSPLOWO2_01_FULL_41_9]